MSTENSTAARPAVFPVVATTAQSYVQADAKARGFTQGHAAGYAAGLQLSGRHSAAALARQNAAHEALLVTLQARHNEEVQALRMATAALEARTIPVLADAEEVLFSQALDLAEALLGQELRDRNISARSALARVRGRSGDEVPVSIRMHPADLAELTENGRDALDLPTSVQLVADRSLNRGDAMADYPNGFLDARLSTAVARTRAALMREILPAHTATDSS